MNSVTGNLGAISMNTGGAMEVEEYVYGAREDMGDDVEQVYETLSDVLTREKIKEVTKMDIRRELIITKSEPGHKEAVNHTFQFHPISSVDTVVRFFVNKFYKRKNIENPPLTPDEEVKEDEDEEGQEDLDADDSFDQEVDSAVVLPPSQDFLRSLSVVYPDIDPEYLNQTCHRFYNEPGEIQDFLETNLHLIPPRRTVQSVQFNVLRAGSNPGTEKMWQCPDCRSWQIIEVKRSLDTIVCKEIISCGEFCMKCNKKSHAPFNCRIRSERSLQEENEMDIFKRLTASPDEIRGIVKIYNLKPKNDVNYSDPLDILYMSAEGTFLRMLRKAADAYGNVVQVPRQPGLLVPGTQQYNRTVDMRSITNRNGIESIQYIENETLKERFMDCKKIFQTKGIPVEERLVFHGTNANLDSIMDQGFLLSKCKRFAHGYGIYFSEFPDISKVYGKNLLLVRVMLGRAYQGTEHKIPEEFNSKLVRPDTEGNCGMIIIENEEQILPAFNINVKW